MALGIGVTQAASLIKQSYSSTCRRLILFWIDLDPGLIELFEHFIHKVDFEADIFSCTTWGSFVVVGRRYCTQNIFLFMTKP
jgi:hypothetical protein